MKTRLTIWILLCSTVCKADTLRWDGQAGDGQWTSLLNWNLDRLPGSSDNVILDNAFVTGSYSVILPTGNTATQLLSLEITPGTLNQITCLLPSSNTASPALTMTGVGDVFILNRGAVFRNMSGAATGTPVTVTASGFVRINNGGHYIHQTARGHTDFLVSRLSAEAGTEEGIFEFDVPGTASYTVSVSNRIFGKLIFSAASAGSIRTYTGAGINPVNIRGGLQIRTNAVFSYGANTDTFAIQGTCFVQEGAVFNIANGGNTSTIQISGDLENRGLITETGLSIGSCIVMIGSKVQSIYCSGEITQQVSVKVNNPLGVLLNTPLSLSYRLELAKGKIFTSAANLLTLGEVAACTGASPLSFVEGPMKKAGNSAFEFPVGAGEIYAPIGIGEGGLLSDAFTAEYKRANPQSTPGLGNNYEPPIHHISYVEYWNLLQVAGNSPRKVTMAVSPYSFAYNFPALVIARAYNGVWLNEGGSEYAPGPGSPLYVTGTFTSATAIDGFGAFTLASTVNQAQNPLPVVVESFTAEKPGRHVLLYWKLGICPAGRLRFELQRSEDARIYRHVTTILGNDTACAYSFNDLDLPKGITYYRLKLIQEDGEAIYSKVISVTNNHSENATTIRVSALVQDELAVFIESRSTGNIEFVIANINGQIVKRYSRQLSGYSTTLYLPLTRLANGVYIIAAATKNGRTIAQRFVKLE